jgi:hypothetical protein
MHVPLLLSPLGWVVLGATSYLAFKAGKKAGQKETEKEAPKKHVP